MASSPRFAVAVVVSLLAAIPAARAADSGIGEVAFANSGAPAAQTEFLRGLAQLHNFEYDDAAAHFRAAEAVDPGFAMAYWGEAMTKTHPVWMQQDLAAGREVLSRLAPTPEARLAKAPTEREKAYLRAIEILYGEGDKNDRDVRFADAMGALHAAYPDDVDAAAFAALTLLGTAHQGRDFAVYMRAAAILEEVFPSHPRHPGVIHYLIHCYDDPVHAPLGLRPARIYAEVAPTAGHAQHMTSHIFVALGRWDDVVRANENAIRVVNQGRAAHGKPPVHCGHYPSWLHYAYLQQGRVADAARALAACRADAVVPPAKPAAGAPPLDPDDTDVGSYASMLARQVIDAESGDDLAGEAAVFPPNAPGSRLTFAYTQALAALRRGDLAAAKRAQGELAAAQPAYLAAAAADPAGWPGAGERAAVLALQVQGLVALAEGDAANGIARLEEASQREAAMPVNFGPPTVDKPSDEVLGEALLTLGRRDEARAAFARELARFPGRALAQRGLERASARAAAAAG